MPSFFTKIIESNYLGSEFVYFIGQRKSFFLLFVVWKGWCISHFDLDLKDRVIKQNRSTVHEYFNY